MSDFSMFSLFTAGLACLVPFTAAYTKPVGDSPVGNPISQPGLNTIVTAGQNFTVTWDPTTKGTVTLLLLKGPSTNAVPQYPIVEKIDNDGEYVWTPKSDLEPSSPDTPAQGYGIQLIDDATGQYQYTTQFGVANPDYKKESSSSSEVAQPTKSIPTYGHQETVIPTYDTPKNATTSAVHPIGTGPAVYPVPQNSTMVAPTGYAPTTVHTSASTSAPTGTSSAEVPVFTGGASTMATSFGLIFAAGAAVFAF